MRTRKADINFFDYEKPLFNVNIEPITSSMFDDIFKASGTTGVDVISSRINLTGGDNREDGVDINNCNGVFFNQVEVRGGKKYAFTIKGGTKFVVLRDVVIHGDRGKENVDIDIGNWSDTNMKQSSNITLANVTRADGRRVNVRLGLAKNVSISGGNVRICKFKSLLLKGYVYLKWLLLKVGITI